MKIKMKIRLATIKDRNFVKQLDRENMAPFFKTIGVRYYGDLFKPFIAKNCFIIETTRPIGFQYFEIRRNNLDLISGQIKKQFQRKGYGGKLIKFLINYAKKKKLDKIRSVAHEKNEVSIKFHKSAGFKRIYKRGRHILFEINLR